MSVETERCEFSFDFSIAIREELIVCGEVEEEDWLEILEPSLADLSHER